MLYENGGINMSNQFLNKTYTKCCSCLSEKKASPYPSCNNCYSCYKKGGTYFRCNSCNKSFSKPSKYGTCYNCYTELKKGGIV